MTGGTTSNTITIIKEPNTSVDVFSEAQMRLAAGLAGGGELECSRPCNRERGPTSKQKGGGEVTSSLFNLLATGLRSV